MNRGCWIRRRGQLPSVLLALLIALWLAPASAQAQAGDDSATGTDWVGRLVSDPVSAIFTPASGALLVRTGDGLLQSDDGGQTFRALPLPPTAAATDRVIGVDPTDQNVLYGSGDELLYQSTDGGATWHPILTKAGHAGFEVVGVTASPANPAVVYAALVDVASRNSFLLLGSLDRGASWTTLETSGPASLCGWGVRLLQAHPSDAMRVFLSSGCFAGRNFGASLQQSVDQGKTFHDWWKPEAAGQSPERVPPQLARRPGCRARPLVPGLQP